MASPLTQRNSPAFRSRSWRAAFLLATLVVGALGIGSVWWWSPAPPPPTNATTISDAAATGEARKRTLELPARSEAATRTAVVGKALDSGGRPLAGFGVTLQRMDPKPVPIAPHRIKLERATQHGLYPPVYTDSDAAGGFAFESLDAGKYRCYLSGLERHAEVFALAVGEVRELTLQSTLVALTSTFLRRGEAMKDCVVVFEDGNEPRQLDTGKTGVIRRLSAPGRCEVIVQLKAGAYHSRSSPFLSRHVLLVPDDVPALQQCFECGGTEIAFAVADSDGKAIDSYRVDVEGVGTFDAKTVHYSLNGKRDEPAAMMVLPAGRWRATVTRDGLRVEPRDFVTGLDDGRVVLSFVASPAGSVRLRLRPQTTFFAGIAAGDMPALVKDGCPLPCKCFSVHEESTPVFDYCAVPPGKATLCFQDRIEGDELVPLPFEPVAPVTIDVAVGRANEVAVDVEPRAFVDLRGCDASGKEMSGAVLTVWVDGRRVRNRDATAPHRWLGWLPRGVHRVVVERNGATREHVLRVDRAHVRERYRP